MKPLQLLHSDATYARRRYRSSLEYRREQSTDRIITSLRARSVEDPLIVGADGKVMQGNTRVKVLLERGYNVNSLPRVDYP